MIDTAADLAHIFQNVGVAGVYNGVTSSGILDIGDAFEPTDQGGMVQVKAITFLCATDAYADLRVGGRIVVDSKPYRIDRVSPEDDGAVTRLYLARAT